MLAILRLLIRVAGTGVIGFRMVREIAGTPRFMVPEVSNVKQEFQPRLRMFKDSNGMILNDYFSASSFSKNLYSNSPSFSKVGCSSYFKVIHY